MRSVRLAILALALLLGAAPAAEAADVFAIGSQSRLTRVGPDGNANVDASDPAVAYNSADNEFLIAWVGATTVGGDVEILGQVLDGNGVPKGSVNRLTNVPTGAPAQPVLSYSPVTNQYILGYIGPPLASDVVNNPTGQREVMAQAVTATGVALLNPFRMSNTDEDKNDPVDADFAADPAIAYDPERDQFRFVWVSDSEIEGQNEVRTQRVSSNLTTLLGEVDVSSTASTGDANEPEVAFLPGQDGWIVVWEEPLGLAGTEIVSRRLSLNSTNLGSDLTVSTATGAASSLRPAVATHPGRDESLVSFIKNDVVGEGAEVFVQRLGPGGGEIGGDQRISTMGPPANAGYGVSSGVRTTATYHAGLDRYFVTWAGDNDLPGLVDNEVERYGQALNADAAEVGGDDFRISTAGGDGNDNAAALDGVTIAVPNRRAWLHVWEGDDNRPPLADGEFELYGRFVGDDGDLDGHVAPADCNDGNAAIHPGAVDVLDNAVDEDCSGADAVSPPPVLAPAGVDADGDGFFAGQDCNDANGAIRPGAVEVRGNAVDENCDRVVEPFPTLTSGVVHNWSFKRTSPGFTLKVLQVTQQFPKGWKAEIKCSGKKCPFKSKALKAAKVKRNASNVIGSLTTKQRRFRAGQTVEVWISAPSFNTKVARIPLKQGKQPVIQALCVVPGQTKPQRSCA